MTRIDFDIFARDHASKTFKELGDHASRTSSKMDKAGKAGGAMFLGIASAAVIFGKKSVDAYNDAEKSQVQLEYAFKRFPKLADTNIESLRQLNLQIQAKTGADDDALAAGEAILAQYGMTGKQLKAMAPLLTDYAMKTGQSIPSAAKNLGKAFLGNTRALKDIGINYKMTGNRAKDMANITALVRKQVGGFAEREGKTAAGQSRILAEEWSNLQEDVGGKLVPALIKVTGVGLGVVGWLQKNWQWVGKVAGVIAVLGGAVWLINKAYRAWIAVQTALNVVLSANPVGLVIIAVAALAAGIIYAYKHSSKFREIVNTAFRVVGAAGKWLWTNAIRPAFSAIVKAFQTVGSAAGWLWRRVLQPTFRFITTAWLTVAGAIIHGAAKAFGWVPGIGGKLRSAAHQFDVFRNRVNSALGGLRSRKITVSATYSATAGGATITAGNFAKRHGLARGGPVPMEKGASPYKDSVLKVLQPGEFVVRRDGSNLSDALAYYGHGMAGGGVVVNTSTPRASSIRSVTNRAYDRVAHTALAGALKTMLSFGGGGNIGGHGVQRWAGLVLRVLSMLHQSAGWLGAVLRRMNQESGGNPRAINLWDSNARAGHPSIGLMQTIGPTFNAYAGPFRGLGIYNPLANIYAGLNYALHRYGSLAALGRPGGYDKGGLLMPGLHLVYNGTGKPETVVPPGAGRVGGPLVVQVLLDGHILAEWVEANGKSIQKGLLKVKRQNGNAALGLT